MKNIILIYLLNLLLVITNQINGHLLFADNFSKMFIILSFLIYLFSLNLIIRKIQIILNLSIFFLSIFFFK